MQARTGLIAAAVAAIVSAAVTAGAFALFAPRQTVDLGNGQMASETQIEQVLADYLAEHPAGLDLDKDADRKALAAAIDAHLLENPEILIQVSDELAKRQQTAAAESRKKAIGENADKLFHSSKGFVAANPDGDVTVVEFFDYNCGYCKHALPDVVQLVEEDPKVRLVLKEFPILTEDSVDASRVALAAGRQGKYFEMHQKLYTEPGKADKAKAMAIAEELGLDMEQLNKDLKDPAIDAELMENRQLAGALGFNGTPAYLIGDQVIEGAPEDLYDQLKADVAEIRKNGCETTC